MPDRVNLSLRATSKVSCIVVGAALVVAGATGCEEQIHVRGNVPPENVVSSIKPGVHKKRDVESMLGAPSAVATFDKETWYYIGGKVKTVSFFTPEVLERKVLTVRFDDRDTVESVKAADAPTETDIQIVERETPTKGKELTVLQQLIGNVGRFGQVTSGEDSGGTGP